MRILFVLTLFSLAFVSCRDGGSSQPAGSSTPPSTTVTGNDNPTSQNDLNATSGNQNATAASAEFHYVCANNCEGSGANAAGTCPVCGEELVHNDAFHSAGPAESPQILDGGDNSFSSKINPLGSSGSEAAPAASGNAQHHYTCSAGCGGGGAGQGACPSCGADLVHNDAFHNNSGAVTPPAGNQAAPTSGNRYPSVFNTPGAVPPANRINSSGGGGGGNGFHYICSAGCGGGGSAQGSCPSCGSALVHNDAFH